MLFLLLGLIKKIKEKKDKRQGKKRQKKKAKKRKRGGAMLKVFQRATEPYIYVYITLSNSIFPFFQFFHFSIFPIFNFPFNNKLSYKNKNTKKPCKTGNNKV